MRDGRNIPFIQNSLKYNKSNIGLFHDYGLATFKNISDPKSEKLKKNIQKLENSTYRPYQKETNQIKYLNTESNHPPSIIKKLLISFKSQLSSLSSSEEIFNDSVTPYKDALDKSGYKHKLKYQANINTAYNKKQKTKKKRKRNITWFNPPYSKNVKPNIEKIFLNLIILF